MTPQSTPLSRRQLLLGGAALLGTASLGGCASSAAAAAGRVPLQYWSLLSGGDGVNMTELVNAVNASQSDYSVQATVLAWGAPYYTKLAMASAGGRGPDVAIMHASRIPGYAPGGLLDPWDLGELAGYGVTQDSFPAPIWSKLQSGGKLYALALDTHPFILMFNTEICGKAGVLDSQGRLLPTSSPAEFLDLARRVGSAATSSAISYGYLGDGAQMWRMFYTFYRQHGATMAFTPGRKPEYDEASAVDSLKFMQSMLDGKIAARGGDYGTAIAEFSGGRSGMLFTGVWELPTMKAAKLPFNATGIPTLFGTPAAYADSHTFVLPNQRNLDPVKRRDSYRFVTQVLKRSRSWAEGGHIPAYTPVRESAAYKAMLPQANYAYVADIVNYDPTAWFTGSGSNFQTYFGNSMQAVLLSGADPKQAITAFMGRVQKLLDQPNPVAKGAAA